MKTACSSAPLLFGAVGGNFSASLICSVENLISKSYRPLSKIIFGKLEQTTLRVHHPPAPETFWKGEATELDSGRREWDTDILVVPFTSVG